MLPVKICAYGFREAIFKMSVMGNDKKLQTGCSSINVSESQMDANVTQLNDVVLFNDQLF